MILIVGLIVPVTAKVNVPLFGSSLWITMFPPNVPAARSESATVNVSFEPALIVEESGSMSE